MPLLAVTRNCPEDGETIACPGAACAVIVTSRANSLAFTSFPPDTYVISTRLVSVPESTQDATPVVGVHESKISAPSSFAQEASVQPRKAVVVLNNLTGVGEPGDPSVLVLLK